MIGRLFYFFRAISQKKRTFPTSESTFLTNQIARNKRAIAYFQIYIWYRDHGILGFYICFFMAWEKNGIHIYHFRTTCCPTQLQVAKLLSIFPFSQLWMVVTCLWDADVGEVANIHKYTHGPAHFLEFQFSDPYGIGMFEFTVLCWYQAKASLNRFATFKSVHQPILGHLKSIQGPTYRCCRICVNPTGYRFVSVNRNTPSSFADLVLLCLSVKRDIPPVILEQALHSGELCGLPNPQFLVRIRCGRASFRYLDWDLACKSL